MALDAFKPLLEILPEVKPPARAPGLKEKLMWTGGVLLLFYLMGQIYPLGADQAAIQGFERFEILLGSKTGTLITTGIGPIVLASIFLQLAVGAKLLNLDLSQQENKKKFQGFQKLLAIVLSLVEGFIYSKAIIVAKDVIDPTTGAPSAAMFAANAILGVITPLQLGIMLQLALGSIFLLYLDEVCQKYGIGSGVSLFIAAGVAQAIFIGSFGYLGFDYLLAPEDIRTEPVGIIPSALFNLFGGRIDVVLWTILPLVFTAIVFLITVYAEGMKIELPLAYGGARGLGARYPIKFLYVSNIPVILASALLLNVQVIGLFMANAGLPLLGEFDRSNNQPFPDLRGGFAYLTSALPSPILLPGGYFTYATQYLMNPTEILHILVYGIVLVILCVVFGWFWIESTGMGAEKVADQLNRTGLQIPGFRQDPRVTEKILQKYIPIITVLGSIFVGILAWFADITGALGTGTGILLTVGILYRFYEDLAQQQIFEMYPILKRISR